MNRLPSIRRWGVAALTGVTLFGGLSIVGAGVASATVPTVSAALATGQSAVSIPGTTAAPTAGAPIVLTINGTPTVTPAPDVITLTLACPTTGSASFASATVTGSADFTTATPGTNSAGCSTLTLVAASNVASPTITVTPSYTLTGVATQSLSISGTYATSGAASTSFTVPTDATVLWYSASSNTPAVTLGASATTAISPIVISDPVGLANADQLTNASTITLTLPTGDVWAGTPTLSAVGATASLGVVGSATLTITLSAAPVNTTASFTVSGASVTTSGTSGLGSQGLTISSTTPANTLFTGVSVGTILGATTTIAGADGTADGTVAAEFENAYPASSATPTSGNRNVVLATDAAHANGSDALAASYLEGTLNTGLLITPATSLGADAQHALQLEGVTTVYVVGGPLAVSPAVIAQIQALPAYNPGGLTTTGSNVKVVGPIYGADGTAEGTAAAIATYYGTAFGAASFPAAYTATGIGAYNTTTGTGSTTAPAGYVPTAVVVASNDWQDAMSIAPEAFKMRFPVVLAGPSSSTTLNADASAALTSLGVKQVIVVGGQLALQNSVEAAIAALNGGISVLRIAGIDATGTAAQIANFALSTAGSNSGLGLTAGVVGNRAVIASHGDYWSDALGAAALGGGANASFGFEPIILTQSPTVVGPYTTAELAVLAGLTPQVTNLTVLGGPLAMPSSTVNTLLAGL